jgi:GntP family gluconate:H+ symporter
MIPPAAHADLWPLAVLAISMALVIILITVLRVHAFLALIASGIVTGLLAHVGTLPGEPAVSHWVQAVELTVSEFGVVCGKIGIVIVLAALIGVCLLESGAADRIVRRFLALFGEAHAGLALLVSGYIVSIPIFYDSFILLLMPLARALSLHTGKNYLLYLMAICASGSVTHCVMIPHPGPLAMAATLHIQPGIAMFAAFTVGAFALAAAWAYVRWINRRMEVPVRDLRGVSRADLEALMHKPDSALPSFGAALSPILVPIAMIAAASFAELFGAKQAAPALWPWLEFLGNRHVAMLAGAGAGIWLLARREHFTMARFNELLGPVLETAGIIILITAAGGAFGLMLRNAGVGNTIQALAAGRQMNLLLLAWGIAAVIRIAQGSATVAMLTTAAMMQPLLLTSGALPCHPVYVYLAIGFGADTLSWMNDSGFWVINKLGGLTERETLKSWTVISTVISVSGLLVTLLAAWLLPCR